MLLLLLLNLGTAAAAGYQLLCPLLSLHRRLLVAAASNASVSRSVPLSAANKVNSQQ
jgi:hypothetical protein